MEEKLILFWFLSISLITQLLGLYIGNQYISLIHAGVVAPIVEQPESPSSSIIIFVYVLLATGLVLIVIHLRKFLLRVLEAFAIFFSSWIAFDVILPFGGIFAAIVLTLWKMFRPSILSKNLAVIFSVAGAGAFIGASLGILPVLIFIVILSVYDFISVFITKHMVYMAKAIVKTQSAFTVSIPHKFKKPMTFRVGGKSVKKTFHVFQLGAGDMFIPLIFAVSVLSRYTILHSIFTIFGSLAALGLLLYFVTKRPGRALPALPIISVGMLVGFLISLVVHFCNTCYKNDICPSWDIINQLSSKFLQKKPQTGIAYFSYIAPVTPSLPVTCSLLNNLLTELLGHMKNKSF